MVFSRKTRVVLRASWPFAPRMRTLVILSLAVVASSVCPQRPLIASIAGGRRAPCTSIFEAATSI
jgi:hypothetical protein